MTDSPDDLPKASGAYLLILRLDRQVVLPPRFDGMLLPAGNYIYAGSAKARGGIRARCRHHLRPRRVRHWHVDWLTETAADRQVAAFPGGDECVLIDRLMRLPGIKIPVPKFGSTDCRQCPAHLVQIDSIRRIKGFVADIGRNP